MICSICNQQILYQTVIRSVCTHQKFSADFCRVVLICGSIDDKSQKLSIYEMCVSVQGKVKKAFLKKSAAKTIPKLKKYLTQKQENIPYLVPSSLFSFLQPIAIYYQRDMGKTRTTQFAIFYQSDANK